MTYLHDGHSVTPMGKSISIRPLKRGDETEWRRLWTAYLEYYESEVSEEVYQTTFARLIDPSNSTQCAAIAVLDGKPVGLVHWILHPHNWKIEDVVYLQQQISI